MRARTMVVGTMIFVAGVAVYLQQTEGGRAESRGYSTIESRPAEGHPERVADSLTRAIAHRDGLEAPNRQQAQIEADAAGVALFEARARAPVTKADILEIETNEAAAQHRWETAMERLYGPTWRAYQQRLEGDARQAAEGATARYGYPVR